MEQHRMHFKASNGYTGSCDLIIYRKIQLVIVSETGEGMSVTNAADTIATEIVKRYGLDPKRMLYIEHWPGHQGFATYIETYDLVTFTWNKYGASSPAWKHLPVEEFNEIMSALDE
ncbi:hypothetical protein GCM10028805_66150 [Spirosoma harenae]